MTPCKTSKSCRVVLCHNVCDPAEQGYCPLISRIDRLYNNYLDYITRYYDVPLFFCGSFPVSA